MGFNRRFDADYARVRRAVIEGEIGEPWLLHLVSRDPEPPPLEYVKTSGGMFLDMTIHDFDMARFLIGATGVYRDLPLHFFLQRYVESYRAEMAAFVDAALDGTPPVTVKGGRAALALGLAALLSYQEQRPVRVSE